MPVVDTWTGPSLLSLAKIQLQVAERKRQVEKCSWHPPDDQRLSAVSPCPVVPSQKYKFCIISVDLVRQLPGRCNALPCVCVFACLRQDFSSLSGFTWQNGFPRWILLPAWIPTVFWCIIIVMMVWHLGPSLIIINYVLFPGLQGLYSPKVSKRRQWLFSNCGYVCPSSWTEPKFLTTLLDREKAS